MGAGHPRSSTPRYGHRSEPHTQAADTRMIASVGSTIRGSSRSSTRTSPGPYITAPRITFSLAFVMALYGNNYPRVMRDPAKETLRRRPCDVVAILRSAAGRNPYDR